MHSNRSLSVVIATLGGESLRATIMQLNRGKFVPGEILVCIPEKEAHRVQYLGLPGVRTIVTSVRGQVAQRAEGFRAAVGEMVMQLDDDIQLEVDCVSRMAGFLSRIGPGNVVGPVYRDVETGECVHRINGGLSGWLHSLYAKALCGAPWGVARMGRATSIGVGYGVDWRHCSGDQAVKTDWLPGGCALCFRQDLVTEAFFPFTGKAYCEDNIHSLIRRQRGLQHWVLPDARCGIEVPKEDFPDAAWRGTTQARRHYVRLSNGSHWRAAIYGACLRVHWFMLDRRGKVTKPTTR